MLVCMDDSGSLNPCYSGRWSRRHQPKYSEVFTTLSLNPCYSGRWSRRAMKIAYLEHDWTVLILVIAVDGLGVKPIILLLRQYWSLNPCYSGRWSRR